LLFGNGFLAWRVLFVSVRCLSRVCRRSKKRSFMDHKYLSTARTRRSPMRLTPLRKGCPAESKAVFWLKLTVLAVLVGSALSVALTVYFYTSNSETDLARTSCVLVFASPSHRRHDPVSPDRAQIDFDGLTQESAVLFVPFLPLPRLLEDQQ
jgi:hypothetical protein